MVGLFADIDSHLLVIPPKVRKLKLAQTPPNTDRQAMQAKNWPSSIGAMCSEVRSIILPSHGLAAKAPKPMPSIPGKVLYRLPQIRLREPLYKRHGCLVDNKIPPHIASPAPSWQHNGV